MRNELSGLFVRDLNRAYISSPFFVLRRCLFMPQVMVSIHSSFT